MTLNKERMLEVYYMDQQKIQSRYGHTRSRSAKSQYLKLLNEDMKKPVFKVSTSMLNFMIIHTKGMTEMKDFQMNQPTFFEEIEYRCQMKQISHSGESFSEYRDIKSIICYFNRTYMLPTPTQISYLRVYNGRLMKMIEDNKVNRTTIYFLLYLIYSV